MAKTAAETHWKKKQSGLSYENTGGWHGSIGTERSGSPRTHPRFGSSVPGEGDLSIGLEQSGGFTLERRSKKAPLSEAGISTHRFLLNERYLPVSPRDMQQHWRFLQNNFERGRNPADRLAAHRGFHRPAGHPAGASFPEKGAEPNAPAVFD
jgi:hypothetical protein